MNEMQNSAKKKEPKKREYILISQSPGEMINGDKTKGGNPRSAMVLMYKIICRNRRLASREGVLKMAMMRLHMLV